jgi:hypothetical protein
MDQVYCAAVLLLLCCCVCCRQIEHFKSVGTAKRGKHVLVREHIICKDVSKGREATPIVAVNDVGAMVAAALSMLYACDLHSCVML